MTKPEKCLLLVFKEHLAKVSPFTKSHICINLKCRGTILPLSYLATVETAKVLMLQFRLHKGIVSQFVIEPVCKAIYDALASEFMKMSIVGKNRIT